ncbi:MAG TPA: hypothetical protein PK447_01410 [Ignavibacteria bacterium]|nr:hypothetical protein [Ignavibacteria bacterium]
MWKEVKGQYKAIQTLKKIYENKRLANAYIFYGPDGIGKDAAAIEFAKLINCENPVNGNEACGACRSCRQTAQLASGFFKFITALPTGKSDKPDTNPLAGLSQEDYDTYLEEINLKIRDSYHTINIPKANNIRIDSIKQIKHDIYLTPDKGRKKVFLISRADMMNIQSANSLLKILEEPPGDSVLILTTSKINSLPPTIIGRCQKIIFDYLSDDDIKSYIKELKPGIDDNELNYFAYLSEGSISKCRNVLDENFLEMRDLCVELLRSVAANRKMKLINDIKQFSKDKEKIKKVIFIFMIWFRDSVYIDNGLPEKMLNSDKSDTIKKFNDNYKINFYKVQALLENALKDLEGNLNSDILLEKLFFDMGRYIKRIL